jgi:hypothetical protein
MHRELPTIFVIAISFLPAIPIGANASPFTIDGSTVYVNGGFVGVRTSTPITVLDVNGDAQFGSGATKSTFTAAGLLKLTSSGIQWADGTTSTTASSGGGGGAVLTATQTFSGVNTFSSIVLGSQTDASMINSGGIAIWAKSADAGGTQSSGCLVGISFVDGSASAYAQFSSTNVLGGSLGVGNTIFGVLLESCSVGNICRVGIYGIFRVTAGAAFNINNYPTFSSTRCGVDSQTTFNGFDNAKFVSRVHSSGSGDFVWLRLGL